MDGVDGVLVDFSDASHRVIAADFLAYPEDLRQSFLALNHPGSNELHRAALAAQDLVTLYAQVCHRLIQHAELLPNRIRAIGAHGQTVRHQPPAPDTHHPYTWQLNQPALLAELTGIAVVADFRSRDLAAGGQGAPLVPPFHAAIFARPGVSRAVVNIGGIANITTLPAQGDIHGMDTGPGNVLLDGWCQQHTGLAFDRGGQWGVSGRPCPALLSHLLGHPFFHHPGVVKSTGRDQFHMAWLHQQLQEYGHLTPQDVQATLAQLTAVSVGQALQAQTWNSTPLSEVIVCGGGSKNRQVMDMLQNHLTDAEVKPSDQLGWPSQWVEPAAFAWLARQHVLGLSGNLPVVTGACGHRILGAYYPAMP